MKKDTARYKIIYLVCAKPKVQFPKMKKGNGGKGREEKTLCVPTCRDVSWECGRYREELLLFLKEKQVYDGARREGPGVRRLGPSPGCHHEHTLVETKGKHLCALRACTGSHRTEWVMGIGMAPSSPDAP